jgi:AcrR family transcriptional regulator
MQSRKSRRPPKVRVDAVASVVPAERPGPEGGKRDANRKARSSQLASAALDLMLARGVEAVTIDEIVSRAGVAKGSFYRYFRDKEDLVRALVDPIERPLREAFDRCKRTLEAQTSDATLAGAYGLFAAELAAVIFDNAALVRLYLQERRGPIEGARTPIAELARFVDRGGFELASFASQRGLTRPGDSRVSAAVVVGAAEHLAAMALAGDETLRDPSVAMEFISIILDGVRASPAAASVERAGKNAR